MTQELEKILEEIDIEKTKYRDAEDAEYRCGLDKAKSIIRKHMNDGWVPVEDRLPEKGGTYIIAAKDGEREIVSFAKWQNRYKRFDMTGARAYWRVVAWMPLPEAYRLEKSEE